MLQALYGNSWHSPTVPALPRCPCGHVPMSSSCHSHHAEAGVGQGALDGLRTGAVPGWWAWGTERCGEGPCPVETCCLPEPSVLFLCSTGTSPPAAPQM